MNELRRPAGIRPALARILCAALVSLAACGDGGDDDASRAPSYVDGEVDVVPRPARVEVDAAGSRFALDGRTRLLVEAGRDDVAAVGETLAVLLQAHGLALGPLREQRGGTQPSASILLTTAGAPREYGDGAYELEITPRHITVRGADAAGVFYGVQSLRQLLPAQIEDPDAPAPPAWEVPSVRIADGPRFGWRGLMLDVSRTFFPIEFLRRYVDLLALFKMNIFHLHLTDDQGWRFESLTHPELHREGSVFASPAERSGYYTQQELRDLVAYARSRHIEIIPEIDMPGHVLAALHALPQLACTTAPGEQRRADEFPIHLWFDGPFVQTEILCACDERIYAVLEDVLDEVADVFPSRYVHLGGDEVPTDEWETSYLCAERFAAGDIDGGEQVQAYFTKRMEQILHARGKVLLAWDEVRSEEIAGGERTALSDSVTIMHWRDYLPAPPGLYERDVVQTPFSALYLDYRRRTLQDVYAYEPVPGGLSAAEAAHVLGAQGNMWTGFPQGRTEERVDLHVFPKLLAIAELTWSPRERRDFADFAGRVERLTPRLDLLGVQRGECPDCAF